jgi:predicted anti-sigma-YlaC factor YlaD
MTCREVSDFLMDYVAMELPADVVVDFERHLSRCANCRTFLSQYEATIKAGKRAFEQDDADASTVLPEDLVKAIMETVKAK